MKYAPPLPQSQRSAEDASYCTSPAFQNKLATGTTNRINCCFSHSYGLCTSTEKGRNGCSVPYAAQSFNLITRRRVYFSSTIKQPEWKKEAEGGLLLYTAYTLTEAPVSHLCKWVLRKVCVHAYVLLEDRLAFSVFGLMQRMKNGLEVLSVAIREWRES